MPPIQQQQTSRAGLITGLVIAIICALGALVWAFMNQAEVTKQRESYTALQKRFKEVVDESTATGGGPDVEQLRGLRTGTTSLFEVANRERKDISKLIAGTELTASDARKQVEAAYAELGTNEALKDNKIPTDTLINAIKALSAKASNDAKAVADAKKAAADAQAAAEAEKTRHMAELAKRDESVKAEQERANKAEADAKAAIDMKQTQVEEFTKKESTAQETLIKAQQDAQQQISTLDAEIKKRLEEISKLQQLLARFKPDVKNAGIRNVDATITQIAPENTCYINLGFGDHVVPGLTFEVYDKLDGIPPLGSGTSNFDMPKGKASIEIIEVGQNSSRCRILRGSPGQQVSQGDVCANLVYDKNIKPVYFVYGNFDMDNNSVATPGEAEVVRNLIKAWGGKVTEKIGPDVDIVVVGKEPVVPSYTPDELADPRNKLKFDEATAALKAFNDMVLKAAEIHIPVLNQNRFLYYTGYFDAAKR